MLSAVRKSFTAVREKRSLVVVMLATADPTPLGEGEVRHGWQTMGVAADALDAIVEVDPHWDGEQLLISSYVGKGRHARPHARRKRAPASFPSVHGITLAVGGNLMPRAGWWPLHQA